MLNAITNILNRLDVHLYVSDMETDEILFVNQKTRDIFSVDADPVGQKCWEVIQTGFSERCPFCRLGELEKNPDIPITWEVCNTVTGRHYKNTDSIIEWMDGRKVHLQYSIDITDAKKAQLEINKSIEVLKNILDGLDTYIYVSDMSNDKILFINKRMKEAFSLDDSAVGQTCWKVLQDGFDQRCSFCPALRLEEAPSVPVVWEEHNTVTRRHYKNVDSIIEWMDGKQVHMQHSSDVTDFLAAQGETREARERLELALTSSQAGVWEMRFDTDTMSYDAMCGDLLSLDPEKNVISIDALVAHFRNMSVEVSSPNFLHESELRSPRSSHSQDMPIEVSDPNFFHELETRSPHNSSHSRDFHFRYPDGGERYVRSYGNVIRNDRNEVTRMVGMCIDITSNTIMENDLKAAKEAAENSNMAKSQFLSNMSHEIRTPMNAIIGMTEILLNDELNERQWRYMNDIRISSTALLSLINDILDFSKIEAMKLQLIPVDYNILEMLDNIDSMFSFAAKSKGLFFHLDIQAKLPACLHGDDIRLRQALINVIGNAIKFTKSGGVTLTVNIAADMLCFSVIDTGIGIKEEDLPAIFKDFSQLDTRNNRNIAGTGLGLSITRNLIVLMNGNISVESEYGKGTVFHLQVPLVEGNAQKRVVKTKVCEVIEAPEAKVLVVDDNEVNLRVADGVLKLSQITCDMASSGREAIRKIKERKYDIVFMDHMMPEMDGVETTKLLRENYAENELVIIALTANAVDGAKEVLLTARMNDYLSKPIDKLQLNQILLKWLPKEKVCTRKITPESTQLGAEKLELSPVLRRIGNVDGINVQVGLDRIGGLRDAYLETMRIFARRLPETLARLEAQLEREDLKAFAIDVHGLKGSLNNLGITQLGSAAEELEARSKNGDLAFCRETLPDLLGSLTTLCDRLSPILFEDEAAVDSAAAGDVEALTGRLAEVHRLLDAFESDAALIILRELSSFDYGERHNTSLKEIIRCVEEFNCDLAMEKIDALE